MRCSPVGTITVRLTIEIWLTAAGAALVGVETMAGPGCGKERGVCKYRDKAMITTITITTNIKPRHNLVFMVARKNGPPNIGKTTPTNNYYRLAWQRHGPAPAPSMYF